MAKVVISLLAATFLAVSSASPIQIQAGFEMLGTVQGKIFLRPINGPGSDNLTFQDAISTCQVAGYKIATLESKAQNDVVEPYTGRWSWIDGIDLLTPDAFFSVNTGKNLTYFNWSPFGTNPTIGKYNYNCIRTSCNALACGWVDVMCTDKYSVICEIRVAM